jgi:hypothetical protein
MLDGGSALFAGGRIREHGGMSPRSTVLLVAGVLALGSGCGDDEPDRPPQSAPVTNGANVEPTATAEVSLADRRGAASAFRRYLLAIKESDGEAACALLTSALRQEVRGQKFLQSPETGAKVTCGEAILAANPTLPGLVGANPEVSVRPSRGGVRATGPGASGGKLEKVGGRWQISQLKRSVSQESGGNSGGEN